MNLKSKPVSPNHPNLITPLGDATLPQVTIGYDGLHSDSIFTSTLGLNNSIHDSLYICH
jgi:hypothetical protein